jgi:hypothetical protein
MGTIMLVLLSEKPTKKQKKIIPTFYRKMFDKPDNLSYYVILGSEGCIQKLFLHIFGFEKEYFLLFEAMIH